LAQAPLPPFLRILASKRDQVQNSGGLVRSVVEEAEAGLRPVDRAPGRVRRDRRQASELLRVSNPCLLGPLIVARFPNRFLDRFPMLGVELVFAVARVRDVHVGILSTLSSMKVRFLRYSVA
jgi:hypothetical protein